MMEPKKSFKEGAEKEVGRDGTRLLEAQRKRKTKRKENKKNDYER